MLPGFLLALREGVEAALIIGIVLGALRKTNRTDLNRVVWLGAGSAAIVSLLAAGLLIGIGVSLEGRTEQIYEGVAMLVAAGLLTWMIFWMRHQSARLKIELESGVKQAAIGGEKAIFSLAFLAVMREGVELAFFLTATALAAGTLPSLLGALLGLAAAILLGWLLYASSLRLDLGRFFNLTSALLILFAAGLVAHGVHELNEAALIPPLIEHVWDINDILPETSVFGELLKALFGYNGNPSLSEAIAYAGYFLALWLVILLAPRRLVSPASIKNGSGGN